MLIAEARTWQEEIITSKDPVNRGRKAKVVSIYPDTTGKKGYMTIKYLDNGGKVSHECNPDNYLLWEMFVKKDCTPSQDQAEFYKAKLSSRAERVGIRLDDEVYIIIRAEDRMPYLVMKHLLEIGFLKIAGTLGMVLKMHDLRYKDFCAKLRQEKKYAPRHNVMLYEILQNTNA